MSKSASKPPRKKKKKDDSEEETSVDSEEEPDSEDSRKRKKKATPGIPLKGFGARKVAVPGVQPSEVVGDEPSDKADESEIEPEKEKTPRKVSYKLDIYLLLN